MDGFKLLALRLIPDTADRFLNNLKKGVVYKFYQNYSYYDSDDVEILSNNGNLDCVEVKVIERKPYNLNLYLPDEKINFNVSAVVGENGSGKSSLVDTLNLIHYTLSVFQFKTIPSAKTSAVNRQRSLANFTVEYILNLQDFVSDELSAPLLKYENVNFGILKERDLQSALRECASYLESASLLNRHKIGKLDGDGKDKFRRLCWKYITEGIDQKYYNSPPLLSESLVHIFEYLNENLKKRIELFDFAFEFESQFEADLISGFNFQLFYEKDGEIYSAEKLGAKIKNIADSYFYSVHLNYSLHSLNSLHMGGWIDNLFHKNDGYQTPVVINPIRDKGNININKEHNLSVDRIVYNIIDQLNSSGDSLLLNKYNFSKLLLTLNPKKSIRASFEEAKSEVEIGDKEAFIDFISTNPWKLSGSSSILDFTIGYTIKKFRKIAGTYMMSFYSYEPDEEQVFPDALASLEEWQREKAKKFVKGNDTHVTRKLNQAYNFLINYEDLCDELPFIKSWDLSNEIVLSIEDLNGWINHVKSTKGDGEGEISTEDLMLNIFPPIFDIDIEFMSEGSPIKLSDFSSGEQQYLFNLDTVVYHLNNLKSIKVLEGEESKHKKYDHINIVLDEIELYYHPQYQKRFVNDIINSIKGLKSLGEMKNFNIVFLTHSPFILSDIVSSNILRLVKGAPDEVAFKQTFGANIHQLLANDFFLKDGYIGAFAKARIQEVIDLSAKSSIEISFEEFNRAKKIVGLIGEPVIKHRLTKMLEDKFPLFQFEEESISDRIKRQESFLRDLREIEKRQRDENNR
jgi:AAA15 family ATPase/GTPase